MINIKSIQKSYLSDTYTPVQMYFNLRDKFPNSILLESSDYNSQANSKSIICCDVLADFILKDTTLTQRLPKQEALVESYEGTRIYDKLDAFIKQFKTDNQASLNGLFGYTSYDSIPFFEEITFKNPKKEEQDIPQLRYHYYRFMVIFDHYYNTLTVVENIVDGEESKLESFDALLQDKNFQSFPYENVGDISSNVSDEQFKEMVTKGKESCQRGDVFQIVLSRQFTQGFKGDDYAVYRALRSINPSPYLFYFDYSDYKIFGSSPEAQVIVENGLAEIHPIAGTFKRTGDDEHDKQQASLLLKDEKETSEHTMLVDLARNDLSINCNKVKVDKYQKIQFFSHVIHMVSRVIGSLKPGVNPIKVMTDSFPAGTLSGAPKYKAMQLIDQFENQARGLYAGSIGYIGFNGDINTAIVIRSFVSKANKLHFQAGAGVVILSEEEKELQEVNHKLGALAKALKLAETLNKK